MESRIRECFVEKRPGFDIKASALEKELSETLKLPSARLRIFNRYLIQSQSDEKLSEDKWEDIKSVVLSEPVCDDCYEKLPPLPEGTRLLYVEPLPGQFDVRADSCGQCAQMLLGGERPIVRTANIYAIEGVSDEDFLRVKSYLINPIESHEASPVLPETLADRNTKAPEDVPVISGFAKMDDKASGELRSWLGFAMSEADIIMLRDYFAKENRDPTLTELRVIDTYWSDHCRHTTFNAIIGSCDINDKRVQEAYDLFLSVKGEKPVTLMNIATAAMRSLNLPMLDVSDENNACTIRIKAEFEHGAEDWLLFFKNETHNHPTEIEPFGGASTCIGGAIRDPLSGRAYVYQSMRITGAGDPRQAFEDTLPGKLPQRKLTVTAAEGFSSYGNQIGLATGYVKEFYHDGYIAKRLETGAVIGAAPSSWVVRERPAPGDAVLLLGGRTGRDGIGGATGSSKIHGKETVSTSESEVQKGNAPEERKLQRLFRNPDVTRLIKKCNDFGAGGVAVAIGEIAEGVEIDLDAVPVKYMGLDGTELAISESQERMAVVVDANDLSRLLELCEEENIEATRVAEVTERKSLVMNWRGKKIVDISRDFLDTNGAERFTQVYVPDMLKASKNTDALSLKEGLLELCRDLNFCSQKGLVERFDSSIGASSVFMPHGGKYALTETQVMASLLPVQGTRTASVMSCGFDPHFTKQDPFAGAAYAVLCSVAKLVAAGVPYDTIHLSLQEYFPSTYSDPARWGLPFVAMLGAFSAQMGLKVAAIGGKDSMSGSFGELDVPPTVVSFAAGVADAGALISPEFKGANHPVYLLETPLGADGMPDYAALKKQWEKYCGLLNSGKVLSAWVCQTGGVYGAIVKMAFGNMTGFKSSCEALTFDRLWGSIVFEAEEELDGYKLLGYTQSGSELVFGNEAIPLDELSCAWQSALEGVFPVKAQQRGDAPVIEFNKHTAPRSSPAVARPKAIIPVFPGTNCEYDTQLAIERAGGTAEIVLIRNLTPDMLKQSVSALEKAISAAQMIVFPGGFSGGDEPDGAGKFIVSLFRNPRLTDAVHDLLKNRDGLILGICNGFQALVKMGLLPFGNISPVTASMPTLTFNTIGRHQARYVRTRISSVLSPWLSKCETGEIYMQPVSHGEGRFTASEKVLGELRENGQIAFQYTDYDGVPAMDAEHNPNGSVWAIEGICSPDGRILGKMAHTERYSSFTAKNIPGNKFMPLFEGGVGYFR